MFANHKLIAKAYISPIVVNFTNLILFVKGRFDIDRDPATWHKFSYNFSKAWGTSFNNRIEDRVDSLFMKCIAVTMGKHV